MTDLHPRDEIAVRQSTSQVTLTAKQIESKRLQAELNRFLALGGQISQPASTAPKIQSFNNGHVLSDKTQDYVFEITPEGKPRPKPRNKPANQSQIDQAAERRQIILAYIKSNGACTVPELADALGYNRSTVDSYVRALIDTAALGYVQSAGKCRHFDLAGRCDSKAREIMGGNAQRARGEITRAHIISVMQSAGRPLSVREIAQKINLAVVTTSKHVLFLSDLGKIKSTGEKWRVGRLYEVVK